MDCCDERVYCFVCVRVSVHEHISKTTRPKYHQIFYIRMLPVAVARFSSGGVALCTSGFVDNVVFAHNGPHGGVTLPQQLAVTSCMLYHFAARHRLGPPSWTTAAAAPRLDESFVQGVPGRSVRRTISSL